jgi:hypothetical protein
MLGQVIFLVSNAGQSDNYFLTKIRLKIGMEGAFKYWTLIIFLPSFNVIKLFFRRHSQAFSAGFKYL